MMKSFRYDAHPMGMLVSTLGAVSTLHPEANPALAGNGIYNDKKVRNKQIHRLLGVLPTLAANAYRHRIGRNYNKPQKNLGYVEVTTIFPPVTVLLHSKQNDLDSALGRTILSLKLPCFYHILSLLLSLVIECLFDRTSCTCSTDSMRPSTSHTRR